jgi:hypothetical protein
MMLEAQTRPYFDRNLFNQWVAANAIGLVMAAGIGGSTTALIMFAVGEFAREVPSEMGAMVRLGITFLAIYLASILGVVGGGSVLMLAFAGGGRLIGETIGYPLLAPLVLGSLVLAVAGAVIGLGHWMVLRRHLPQRTGWVLTNIVGWAVAGLIPGLIVNSDDTVSFPNAFYETGASLGAYGSLFSFGLVVGAVGGGVSGVLQYMLSIPSLMATRFNSTTDALCD